MWRSLQQLIYILRRDRPGLGVETARTARLGIETLENRTVLSANFGVDLEAVAYHDFNTQPPPRILIQYVAPAALAVEGSESVAAAFAENFATFQEQYGEIHLTVVLTRSELHPEGNWFRNKWSSGDNFSGEQIPVGAVGFHSEDKVIGSTGSKQEGPLKSQSQTPADNDAGPNNSFQNSFASKFEPPRIPGMTTLLDRIAETRRVATSPFPTPIVTTTTDNASTVDAESLLATYATLAASLEGDDDSSATSHDAAFDGYAPSRSADAGTDEYIRLLAEDQTHDATADAGGFIELDEARIANGHRSSNLLADAQRKAIESALRSLSARRGDAQTLKFIDSWLEQAWLAAETTQQSESTTGEIANEPGGMILLLQMTDGTGEELIAAGNIREVIKTAVEMEATIGTYQAFDVSIDEASTAHVKSTQELGGKQDREELPRERTGETRAASGAGVISLGVVAFAAKRKIENRKRSRS